MSDMDEGDISYTLRSCKCGCVETRPPRQKCPHCNAVWPETLRERQPYDGGPVRFTFKEHVPMCAKITDGPSATCDCGAEPVVESVSAIEARAKKVFDRISARWSAMSAAEVLGELIEDLTEAGLLEGSTIGFHGHTPECATNNGGQCTCPARFDAAPEAVDHPAHYGGEDNPYEAIKVIEAWLTPEEYRGFLKGTALKYMGRAGKKDGQPAERDWAKSRWYLRELETFVEKERRKLSRTEFP